MRFLKNLFVAILCPLLVLSAVVFVLSCSAVSLVGSSLVMSVLDAAGGSEALISEVLDANLPNMPIPDDARELLREGVQAALTPGVVRDILADGISGLKNVLQTGNAKVPIWLDLTPIKASFRSTAVKGLPASVSPEDVEAALARLPDKVDMATIVPLEPLAGIQRPYKIFTSVPLYAAGAAAALFLLIGLTLGWRPGAFRTAGICIAIGSLVVLVAIFAGSGFIEKLLQDLPALARDLPIEIHPRALAGAAVDFVLSRLRLVSACCAALGFGLAFAPALAPKRKHAG